MTLRGNRMTSTAGSTNLVGVEDAAAILGIQVSTLYAWVEQERVPHIRLGRAVRFDPGSLSRWIDEHRVEPGNR